MKDILIIIFFSFILLCIIVACLIMSNNLIVMLEYYFSQRTARDYWRHFIRNFKRIALFKLNIFAFVLAIIFFVFSTPIKLLLRQIHYLKHKDEIDRGELFVYNAFYPKSKDHYYVSNIKKFGLEGIEIKVTGVTLTDSAEIIEQVKKSADQAGISCLQYSSVPVELRNNRTANLQYMFSLDAIDYPVFWITNSQQADQYRTITASLALVGYKKCIYFSAVPI